MTTLSHSPARVGVEIRHTGGDILVEILNPDGSLAARGRGDRDEIELSGARLWSEQTPNLYICRCTLEINGAAIDIAETTFGIRTLSWSPSGFLVNGTPTLLRGGCIHHDNGILGACAYPVAEERKVRILKGAGFNAVRSAYNPCSDSMLAACDRLGMFVMDETWDMWYSRKNTYDYAQDFPSRYPDDIRALIARDYNHPSVILCKSASTWPSLPPACLSRQDSLPG
ncbi:Beta-galactosidase [bioreactor metagenome]|uniref:Beta-galactosidase n=1 Tax=bioreactor metagenome TaxID=1076179 RepID=A0A645CU31_9ZZZZ